MTEVEILRNLDDVRKEIIDVDKTIAGAFEKRMELAGEVAAYKRANNLPVFDKSREKLVEERFVSSLSDGKFNPWARKLINSLMDYSKEYQKEILKNGTDGTYRGHVVYQGIEGSYGSEAAEAFFKNDADIKGVRSFEEVFDCVESKSADFGVLPIENSSTGAIADVYDLLASTKLKITGEYILPVHHCLMAKRGTLPENIKTIYSHSQGIEQCSLFLKRFSDARLVPYFNTAISAKFVSESDDFTSAAIASKKAAEKYGLEVLYSDINNNPNNFTRFIIIEREGAHISGADKVSAMFTVPHVTGSLAAIIAMFGKYKINMEKIESRPVPNKSWEYRFFVDFDADTEEDNAKKLISDIKENTSSFVILGNYKSAKK